MNYILIRQDELYHHGVKGMRWGVRHERKSAGKTRKPRPLNALEQANAQYYQDKYGVPKEEAEAAARKRTKTIAKVAVGTAIVAGAVVGGMALSKYGRLYADEVIRKGTTLQTVHHRGDIIDTGKFYSAKRLADKMKYKAMFGEDEQGIKKRITAEVGDTIRIAGNKNAKKIYNEMLGNNSEFRNALGDVDYKKFNTYGLLGDGHYLKAKDSAKAQKLFIDELKKRGYSGVADINDRVYSGFNTKANIYFDTSKISKVKIHDMTKGELNRATAGAFAVSAMEGLATPMNGGVTIGVIGAGVGMQKLDNQEETLKKKYKNGAKS